MDWVASIHIYKYPDVPLNVVGWLGSQVTAHAKALAGTMNTASLNLFEQQPERIYRDLSMLFCV